MEILKIDVEKARDKLANTKLKLREQQKGGRIWYSSKGVGKWESLIE